MSGRNRPWKARRRVLLFVGAACGAVRSELGRLRTDTARHEDRQERDEPSEARIPPRWRKRNSHHDLPGAGAAETCLPTGRPAGEGSGQCILSPSAPGWRMELPPPRCILTGNNAVARPRRCRRCHSSEERSFSHHLPSSSRSQKSMTSRILSADGLSTAPSMRVFV